MGKSLSLTKLYNDLRSQGRLVSKDALHAYVNHFEDAFLCFAVPLHDASPRKAETAPKKVYGVDPGLVAAFRMGAEDLGRRFENLVYLDFRRKGCEVSYYLDGVAAGSGFRGPASRRTSGAGPGVLGYPQSGNPSAGTGGPG